MKTRNIYFIAVLVILIIAIVAESNAPVPINWTHTYSMYDKIPYGDYIVYDVLPDLFPGKKITVSNKPLYTAFNDSITNTNLIIIDNYFEPDSLDAIKLLSYVHRGNNAFIAASNFNGVFADSLMIETDYYNENYFGNKDSITLSLMDSTDQVYAYKKGAIQHYFVWFNAIVRRDTIDGIIHRHIKEDTLSKTVLSKNSNDKDVLMAIKFGKGTVYISSVPNAFTNYNMLNGNNSEYISRCLSHLPVADTYWDEHYKAISHKATTPLRYILSAISLRYAYYIMISGLLLYIIFEGKRRQRIVPVIKPLKNTSLDFTETIGLLYYEKGNNIGMAQKRIHFLLDTIRTKYKMNIDESNPHFFSDLSSKTMVNKEELTEMFKFIRYVEGQNFLTSQSLLKLNNLIENFYNKTS